MKTDETMDETPTRVVLRRAGQKLVRVDRPFDPDADPKAEAVEGKGSLIASLLSAIRSDPVNRRRDPRHPALDQDIWVGWWTGEDFGAVTGRLLNISRGGAQVVIGRRPPRKAAVWIYRDVGSTLASARGAVVALSPAPGGLYSVRFRFESPCPTALCEAVVCRRTPTTEGRV